MLPSEPTWHAVIGLLVSGIIGQLAVTITVVVVTALLAVAGTLGISKVAVVQ